MRIWAKVYKEEHIIKQCVLEENGRVIWSHFFEYLTEMCYQLDIPTPVLLKPHLLNFAKFRHVKFLPRDFMENVDFDYFWVENITE